MTPYEKISLVLAVLCVLLLPAIALMIRLVIKWTRTEKDVSDLLADVRELVEAKDRDHAELRADEQRTHTAMLEQMRADREATDKRLRFLEEFWMTRRGRL